MNLNNKNYPSSTYATAVVCLVGLIICTAFPDTVALTSAEQVSAAPASPQAATSSMPIGVRAPETSVSQDPFENLALQAHAAYVYDVTDKKILFEKNASQALPLASLTKIMTAATAADTASSTAEVSIPKEALDESGDTGLFVDEKWQLSQLLRYTLAVSSNDGAAAVAIEVGSLFPGGTGDASSSRKSFISQMNMKAGNIGLANTIFYNATGLDESATLAGAYGSARDVSKMLLYAVNAHPDIFEATRRSSFEITSESGIVHTAVNTDILASKIPGLIAGKTGYTTLAGGNLAIMLATKSGHTIVVVALGSSYDGRFVDVDSLASASESVISGENILSKK